MNILTRSAFRFLLLISLSVFLNQSWAAYRIVSLAPNWSHTVAAVGAEHDLVGVTRYARFPQTIPDAVASGDLVVVGGFTDIDIDLVLKLKPDLVLTATGLQLHFKQALEEQGINVLHMQESSLSEVYEKILTLGAKIDKKAAAKKLVLSMKNELANVANKYKDKPKVKVYYEINYLYKCVPGADSYITELIRLVGGEPILAQRSGIAPMVTWPEVVNENPDVILLPMWPGASKPIFVGKNAGSGTTTVAEVNTRDNASTVNAIVNHHVVFIDSAVTKQAGPSIPNAAKLLAEAIHSH
jgi:iron complex transport system substrate-binding protein